MATLSDVWRREPSSQPVGRFAVVGALGTAVDVGLFTGLHTLLGVPTLAANTLSYSAGIVNNYVLHRQWTYAARPRKALHVQFGQFLAVSVSALLLNNVLVYGLARLFAARLAGPAYADLLAKACATGVGMGWNYLANNYWTFRDAKKGVSS